MSTAETAKHTPGPWRTGREDMQSYDGTTGRVSQDVSVRRNEMANLNGYPEKCDDCGKRRTCNGAGQCHECAQADREASVIVDENGEEWTPGGFAL